jgi:hypothetical protein
MVEAWVMMALGESKCSNSQAGVVVRARVSKRE